MIFDKENLFSEDQDLAQGTGTYNSTNVIDLGSDRMGEGQAKELVVRITEAFASGGAATLAVALQTDDAANFPSPTTVITSPTYALADLGTGDLNPFGRLPDKLERYVRLTYTIGTAAMTAGKVFAGLTPTRQTNY